MNRAEEVLRELGWGKNEAACYRALVEYGEMKASDIGTIVDLASSKVYPELQKLVKKGYVLERGEDPKIFAAQNPRYVIRQEEDKFETQIDVVSEELQEAWEIQEESSPPSEEHAWILSGRAGMNTQFARIIDFTDHVLCGYDGRLPLTTPETFESLVNRVEDDMELRLIARENARERLLRLKDAGGAVRRSEEIEKSSFYIADNKYLLININGGKSTIMFRDKHYAEMMIEEFERLFAESTQVQHES